jgi:hypothetical protein
LKLTFFLSQDIENLQKHAELFLIERRAAYRRFAPTGLLNKLLRQLHSIKNHGWQFIITLDESWVCFSPYHEHIILMPLFPLNSVMLSSSKHAQLPAKSIRPARNYQTDRPPGCAGTRPVCSRWFAALAHSSGPEGRITEILKILTRTDSKSDFYIGISVH